VAEEILEIYGMTDVTPEQAGCPRRATYSVEEAADILGIGRATAYAAARRGDLPTIKIGKRILVPRVALDRLLEDPAVVAGANVC
jgi:excisionase family DNA binding protein